MPKWVSVSKDSNNVVEILFLQKDKRKAQLEP